MKRLLVILVFLLSFSLFFLKEQAYPKDFNQKPANILILHSYHHHLEWTKTIQDSIEKVFNQAGLSVNLYVEYLDSLRNPDKIKLITPYLLSRYQNISLSGIIVSDNDAFEWIKENQNPLFSSLPIVFCGLNNFSISMIENIPHITGVAEKPSFYETLLLIQKQNPSLKKLLVLGDSSNITFYYNKKALEEALNQISPSFNVEYGTSGQLDFMIEKIKNLPPSSAVFLMAWPLNEKKEILSLPFATKKMTQASNYPIYTGWDFLMGNGILGGKLISGSSQGEKAALMMVDILQNNKNPQEIPIVEEDANQWIFDKNTLKAFKIKESTLPPFSTLLFHNISFYQKNKSLIHTVLLIILFLLGSIFILFFNIQKRIRAEKAAKASEQRWKFALEGVEHGIWEWDLRTNKVDFSSVYFLVLGYQKNEMPKMMKEWENLLYPEDREQIKTEIKNHLKGLTPFYQHTYRILKKDGTYIWLLDRGKVMEFDENQKPLKMLGVHTNITEQKKIEATLLAAKEEAERTNQSKREFLSHMSHEIRTPLTGIIGSASLLAERKGLPDSSLELVEIIKKSSVMLLNLLNDFLDLAKIEAGKMKIQPRMFSPHNFFNDIQTIFKLLFQHKNISFILEKQEDLPPFVFGDEFRIKQILNNLLSNALKFTYQGAITFGLSYQEPYMIIKVSDTGVGIGEKKMAQLFESFDQEKGTTAHKYGGTGLGLSIVKKLVDLMQGKITAQSTLNEGTSFFVKLPLPLTEKE